MVNPTLDPEQVQELFVGCLFKEGEDTTNHVKVEGVMSSAGFNPERLKDHEAEIIEMLHELPTQFREKEGGGWSFLQACEDRHGNQWTGLHQRMSELFMLGMGIGKVECQLPREMWKILPGGVPYYVIKA